MKNDIIDWCLVGLSSILTISQTNEVFKAISLVLTILSVLVILARNIYDWYIKAKEDKKIDKEEIKDLIDIVGDSVEDINQVIKGKDDLKDEQGSSKQG